MADKEIAVSVRDIHKEFVLPQSKNSTFKQTVVNIVKKNNKVTQKTLDGVSFDIHKGDFFGIVGRNGSGKSTLLKLIAGVYTPTAGSIEVRGGLTPFIELGVGFNPELSGRDNVYLNGALLGFTRKQMDEMYSEIVAFAELEPFMDQKLKNYSSGMQVRLAFSIAIKAKNDVLIFDEVLAVGDEAFQRKCLNVFERYKAEGQTVILVTHDMQTVKNFCTRAVLIQDGAVIENGDPIKVADKYSAANQDVIDQDLEIANHKEGAVGVLATNELGEKTNSFTVGEKVTLEINWDSNDTRVIMVDLYKNSGELITNFISKREGMETLPIGKKVKLDIQAMVTPGSYHIDVSLWDADMKQRESVDYGVYSFMVTNDFSRAASSFGGLTFLKSTWRS